MNARYHFPSRLSQRPSQTHSPLASVFGLGRFLPLLAWLLCLVGGIAQAQDTPNDNPTGPTGDYNGEVTTGGSYDPFTLNAKRAVTDLVVPGSNGTYPLAFSRTYNSGISGVAAHDLKVFGDGGNWRHSYQWTITPTYEPGGGPLYGFTVSYPSGGAVTFVKNRKYVSTPTGETYWRGPTGVEDRLELPAGGSYANAILHTTDGGLVYFSANYHPLYIVDPYGATTSLQYNGSGYLTKVIEPGGRFLYLEYQTVTSNTGGQSNTWVVLKTVTANGTSQSTLSSVQRATCNYSERGSHLHDNGNGVITYSGPYYVLTDVSYDSEPSVSAQGGNVHASYTHLQSGTAAPVIETAVDPHYAGAMTSIRYLYSDPTYGFIQEEQNINSPNQRVSRLDHADFSTVNEETRGDVGAGGAPSKRTFRYVEPSHTLNGTPNTPTNAKYSQLTSVTDFQGNNTNLFYYGPGDPNGDGNLFATTDAANRTTIYGREPFTGKVKSLTLPDGRVRQWLYWSKNYSETDGYLRPYYLFQSTDERGQVTTYQRYPNTGLVSEIDYPDQSSEQFSYTAFAPTGGGTYYKIGYQKTKLGAQIYYTYGTGGSGRSDLLLSVERYYNDGTGAMRSEKTYFEYDAFDRLSKTTDPGGVATKFTYNARHQLTSTIHLADNTHVDRAYDDKGNCTDVTDELNHTFHTNYDEYRRVTSVVTPVNDGLTANRYQSFAYDRYGDETTGYARYADARTHTASNWGASWAPSSKAVVRVFSPNNWLTDQYDGMWVGDGGNGTVTPHQGAGYVHTSVPLYNGVGQVLTSVDAQGQTTLFTYDNCGRKQSVTDPLGHATTWTYYAGGEAAALGSGGNPNCGGWLKSVTAPGPDLQLNPTITTVFRDYDKMGRVTATRDPYNHDFLSGYDLAGDLIAQTDGDQPNANTLPQPHNTGYVYDGLGRKVALTNPKTGAQEKWAYDTSGNVKTYTNYAGKVCTYNYDGRNRCTGYSWADGSLTPPTSYAYDTASRVTGIDNWHADIRYTYDDSGAVLTEQTIHHDTGATGTVAYVRDLDGNVDHMVYPGGITRYYQYDNQQRCTGMYAGSTTYSQYNYTNDRLTGRWLGNGLYTGYAYQANGRVNDVFHYRSTDRNGTLAAGGGISERRYGYEPDGQISWIERKAGSGQSGNILENGNGDVFAYDPDGSLHMARRNVHFAAGWPTSTQVNSNQGDSQMSTATPDGGNATADTYDNTYLYDAAGNRTQVTLRNVAQPTVGAGGDNERTDSAYDANFNTTFFSGIGSGWTYGYDSENHLINASGPSGASALFRYDGLGRMCSFVINGTFVRFYYAGSQRIEERDSGNGLIQRYYFDAPGSDQILYREGPSGYASAQYYQYDLLGNTTHLTDGTGAVIEQYLYDAYGTPSVYNAAGNLLGGSTCANRYQFKGNAGYYWLGSMQLFYVRARFYLPQHGRWLQTDPIGQAGGLNVYTYCGNDPVNGVDPSGLEVQGHDPYNTTISYHPGDDFPLPTSAAGYPIGSGASDAIGGGSNNGTPLSPLQRGVSTYSGFGGGNGFGSVVRDNTIMGGIGSSLYDTVAPIGQAIAHPINHVMNTIDMMSGRPVIDAMVAMGSNPRATWAAVQQFAADAATTPRHTIGYGIGLGAMALIPGGAEERIAVTEMSIARALEGSTLTTTQKLVSLGRVEKYVRMLEAGGKAPEIGMDGNILIDGHHRYIAGRLFGIEPPVGQMPGAAGSRASTARPITEILVDPANW